MVLLCGSITFPNQLVSIGEYAFSDCSSLSTVTIPSGSIGNLAFAYSGLTSVTMLNGVSSIGEEAFTDCEQLSKVILPNTITSIGTYAFANCSSLSGTITVSASTLGDRPFQNTGLESITFSGNVVTIPASICNGLSSLKNIVMQEGVTTIETNAFSDCEQLENVTIPNSLTSIGNSAFFGCEQLTDVYYNGTSTQFNEIDIDAGNDNLIDANLHFNSSESSQSPSNY